MYLASHDECAAADLDPDEVNRIARGLDRYAKQAHKLGLHIFGGSGSGTLRFGEDQLVVADILNGHFDGGDGSEKIGSNGLRYGET